MSDIDPAVARAVDEIDYVGCNTVNPYNYLAEIMFLTSAAWSSGAKRFTLSAIAARAVGAGSVTHLATMTSPALLRAVLRLTAERADVGAQAERARSLRRG